MHFEIEECIHTAYTSLLIWHNKEPLNEVDYKFHYKYYIPSITYTFLHASDECTYLETHA